MASKPRPGADKDSLFDSEFAATVKESAQQIWLAGLGAFAKAQEEGGKVFEALVKDGATLQKKTQDLAGGRFSEVTSRMTGMAEEAASKAGQQWDRLESIFEERTAKALARLGVPSAKDIAALHQRLDELGAQLARQTKAARAPRKTAARTPAPPKPKAAVRKATRKTTRSE